MIISTLRSAWLASIEDSKPWSTCPHWPPGCVLHVAGPSCRSTARQLGLMRSELGGVDGEEVVSDLAPLRKDLPNLLSAKPLVPFRTGRPGAKVPKVIAVERRMSLDRWTCPRSRGPLLKRPQEGPSTKLLATDGLGDAPKRTPVAPGLPYLLGLLEESCCRPKCFGKGGPWGHGRGARSASCWRASPPVLGLLLHWREQLPQAPFTLVEELGPAGEGQSPLAVRRHWCCLLKKYRRQRPVWWPGARRGRPSSNGPAEGVACVSLASLRNGGHTSTSKSGTWSHYVTRSVMS